VAVGQGKNLKVKKGRTSPSRKVLYRKKKKGGKEKRLQGPQDTGRDASKSRRRDIVQTARTPRESGG